MVGYMLLSSLRRKNAFQTKKRIKGKVDIGKEGKEGHCGGREKKTPNSRFFAKEPH